MFKRALVMLSIFVIASKVESSDSHQNLRYRRNGQIFYVYNLIPNAQVVPEENIAQGNFALRDNRFNGITVINQNQTISPNQELDKNCQCSEYGCCAGMGLFAYWATGSASMGIATPIIVSVAAACMYTQSMQ